MVQYINNNYPENFNDWIASSEFVSLIELMAFLGHNLAFRADLATRENFLSTAERRESALRIADFLGYTPTRNIIADGYLKVESIRTNETLFDVDGNSLSNVSVQFEDVTDPDTYQNFLTIMNGIFQSSSQFGSPFAKFVKDGIINEIYRTNSRDNQSSNTFSGSINGRNSTFSNYSPYYNQSLNLLEEKEPDAYSVIDLLYTNDNGGFTSSGTGFFLGFKQGTLEYQDFRIDNGLPNMVLDINVDNVANGNVWVQNIDEIGQIQKSWSQVDKLFGLNSIFNASSNNIRDIYSVASREDDQISIVFSDGEFGNIPRGLIRVWYRIGLNTSYSLQPDSFSNTNLQFNYTGNDGNSYSASMTLSLRSNVTNASERESIDSIKVNAGRFFATQDRMVTADDYSLFPITVSENIRKIKAVNRVHSGHSRFRDIYDPTATYSDAIQFFDDGYIYEENVVNRSVVGLPTMLNGEQIYSRYIKPLLNDSEVKNFYYGRHNYTNNNEDENLFYSNPTAGIPIDIDNPRLDKFTWTQISKGPNSSTGYITQRTPIQRLGNSATNSLSKCQLNGLIEFEHNGNLQWTRITRLFKDGLGQDSSSGNPTGIDNTGRGAVSLNAVIPSTATITRLIPSFADDLTDTVRTSVINALGDGTSTEFGLRYDPDEQVWKFMQSDSLGMDNAPWTREGNDSWVIRLKKDVGVQWEILTRKDRIVFGSDKAIRFNNLNFKESFSSETLKPQRDSLTILDINQGIDNNFKFNICGYFTYLDGYTDPRKIRITLDDPDNDGFPNDPEAISKVIGNSNLGLRTITENGNELMVRDPNVTGNLEGKANLRTKYSRISDINQVIDPAITNIIDTYVLLKSFDNQYRTWAAYDGRPQTKPNNPTVTELTEMFRSLEEKKTISDQVIYRPVKYKILFGDLAASKLQARFNVVKTSNSTMSDTEIKQEIIRLISQYFNIDNWDLGEDFYFTEMAAFIHQNLIGQISQITIRPVSNNSKSMDLFEIFADSDELFLPVVALGNITVTSISLNNPTSQAANSGVSIT